MEECANLMMPLFSQALLESRVHAKAQSDKSRLSVVTRNFIPASKMLSSEVT